jgi:hypothetical protein
MATMTTEDDVEAVLSRALVAGSSLDGALPACLVDMAASLDDAADLECGSLSEAQLRASLDVAWRVRARVEQVFTRLVAEADQRGLPVDDGASSTRAWLAWRWRMSRGCAGAVVSQTTAMSPRVSETRRAWADGDIAAEQAAVIATTIDGLSGDVDADRCRRAEKILVERAGELTYRELRVLANRVIEVVDPDGADARIAALLEAEEEHARQSTSLRRFRRGDGTTTVTGRIPDLHADMLYRVLGRLAAPRRVGASHADTGTGAGSVLDVDGAHCDREGAPMSAAQRYGQALCELIEHLPTDGLPSQGAGSAAVVVTVDHDRLTSALGEALLDTGGRISAGQARRLACNAAVLPMVLGGDSVILDQGRSRRLFDRHQRVALAVRDKGCIWPGCDRPPAWAEAHHIGAWSSGGSTDLANGCLLCSFHHHLLHKGEWAIRMAADGIPEVLPPGRVDPQRRPMRHQRFGPLLARIRGAPQP